MTKKQFKITVTVDLEELKKSLDEAEAAMKADEDIDDEVPTKPTTKSKKAEPEEDEDFDETEADAPTAEEDEADEDDEPAPKKPAKDKAVSSADVNAACKKRLAAYIDRGMSSADARARIVKVLKTNFKVASVAQLRKEQYAEAIKLLT